MSQATRILLALIVGLAAGIALAGVRRRTASIGVAAIAQPIGSAWLQRAADDDRAAGRRAAGHRRRRDRRGGAGRAAGGRARSRCT